MPRPPPPRGRSPTRAVPDAPYRLREARARVVVVGQVRIYREALAAALAPSGLFEVAGVPPEGVEAACHAKPPDLVLLESACAAYLSLARRLLEARPSLVVAAVADSDTDEDILRCAEAGLTAFVPASTTPQELPNRLAALLRGELSCPPRLVARLYRRLSELVARRRQPPGPVPATPEMSALTQREQEIAAHLAAGLSNKEIARALRLSLSTVKNHVHAILGKLQVARRREVAALVDARPPAQPSPAAPVAEPRRFQARVVSTQGTLSLERAHARRINRC